MDIDKKKIAFALILSFIFVGIIIFAHQYYFRVGMFFCAKEGQFSQSLQSKKELPTGQQAIINPSGTVHYFEDNFDKYEKKSKLLESFEFLREIELKGNIDELSLSEDSYNGDYSLMMGIEESSSEDEIIIRKKFNKPFDLSRWSNAGFFTAWLKIEDRKGISGVTLKIGDDKNNYREFNKLLNLQLDIPDSFDNDDILPNIEYPIKKTSVDEWTDFILQPGWNYLLWRADNNYFVDFGDIDMRKISWFEVILHIDDSMNSQNILIDNFRVQDGIQKENNPLNGVWYPPHGRPQYGIFDVDKYFDEKYKLKLLNVRQSQYPSNGDHGRMILNYKTPLNFTMRTRFELTDFVQKGENKYVNTWFRMMYDFDPVWDPGHDWFGAYISLEWEKFGLINVKPIERFVLQEQEPKNEDILDSTVDFMPKENVLYEMHLTIEGQNAKASIYEVKDECLQLKRTVGYEFKRPRYDNSKRYPFALEITGNVKAIIHEVKIIEL